MNEPQGKGQQLFKFKKILPALFPDMITDLFVAWLFSEAATLTRILLVTYQEPSTFLGSWRSCSRTWNSQNKRKEGRKKVDTRKRNEKKRFSANEIVSWNNGIGKKHKVKNAGSLNKEWEESERDPISSVAFSRCLFRFFVLPLCAKTRVPAKMLIWISSYVFWLRKRRLRSSPLPYRRLRNLDLRTKSQISR